MPVLDALKAWWILVIFIIVFFWFPAHLFSGRSNPAIFMRIAGNWARMVVCVTMGFLFLASFRVLSAITVVFLFVGAFAMDWHRKRATMTGGLLTSLQAAVINIMRKVEARSFRAYLLPQKSPAVSVPSFWKLRVYRWLKGLQGKEMVVAFLAVVLATSVILRTTHAVRELRFDQPEQYSVLLRARELMLNLHPVGRPLVFPAVITATSLLSGADAMQVTRVLSPAVELFVVLAAGLLIHVCARVRVACVAALYCLGAAAFPPAGKDPVAPVSALEKVKRLFGASPAMMRSSTEFGLGLMFLLLALALLVEWYRSERSWESLLDFGCCLFLTAIVSQFLLLILMTVAVVVLLRPMAGLAAFVVVCYSLAAYMTLSAGVTIPEGVSAILPVAAAVLVGLLVAILENRLLAYDGRTAQTVLLAACLSVAVIWLRPQRLVGRYLEYEASARATQEIISRFPRQTWVVVAPVEQLDETLGLGAYEDLAGFVEKYRERVLSPEFRFQEGQENLFIYVEKRPFQIFAREPETVSFSVLTDPTYINYRSPGGRASLEAAALLLCEAYRQQHANANVFFENEDLRIYHVHQQRAPDTKRQQ
jgi:hypothetical protein